MSKEKEECWSSDGDNFCHASLGDLLDCDGPFEAGRVVYVADAVRPTPEDLIGADDVIETIACRGSDYGGEWADDFPDVTKEAVAELDALLHAWVTKHCEINFWQVVNVREHVLSAEDVE